MNFLKTSNPETLSKYFQSPNEVNYIVQQLEKHPLSKIQDDGSLDKFTKMSSINELVIAEHIENTYGIKGVGLSNLSDIFSPKFTKNFDVWDVRNMLLQKGMPSNQINKIMEDRIFELNDFGKGPFRLH